MPKIQGFMYYQNVTFTSEGVTPHGSNSRNGDVGDWREAVIKSLYLALLPCEENWFTIYSCTACVRSGVEFTAGLYPLVRR